MTPTKATQRNSVLSNSIMISKRSASDKILKVGLVGIIKSSRHELIKIEKSNIMDRNKSGLDSDTFDIDRHLNLMDSFQYGGLNSHSNSMTQIKKMVQTS